MILGNQAFDDKFIRRHVTKNDIMNHPELTARAIFTAYNESKDDADNASIIMNLEQLNELASAYMVLAMNLSRVSEQLRDTELRTGRIRQSIDKLL